MDRLTEMDAFVNVVDQGGFTGASDRLGISKSAVSKHVTALESRLGARLLNRTTRRVSPTEIGLIYYDRARRVLVEATEADETVTALQSTPRGLLRISAPASFGHLQLAPAVADFLAEFPEVQVDMDLSDNIVDLVAGGFDLALRIGQLQDSSLRVRKIAQTQPILFASPEYLARNGTPQRIEDLNDHALLHYSLLASGNSWRLRTRSGQDRQLRIGGRLTANNGEVLLQAAKRGAGIAFAPSFLCCAALQAGDIVEVLADNPQPPIGIHLVYVPGRYVQPKIRSFIDHMVGHFANRGPVRWTD